MQAVLVVGHGSLRAGSGASMIRLAARLREARVAPIVEAGFLNYSRPTFAQALARCLSRGATRIVVLPYFLVPGKFVAVDLPRLIARTASRHPTVQLLLAAPFGDHPALAELVLKRAAAAGGEQGDGPTGLAIMAHGSPDPDANLPIESVAGLVREQGRYAAVSVCYMDLNDPSIPAALDELVERGMQRIIALPYFLQLGGHVAEDLPASVDAARSRHPMVDIQLAEHLAYDPLLVTVMARRSAEISVCPERAVFARL